MERPRVRAADGSGEVPVATYQHFAGRDVLGQVVLARMLASVSTRHYRGTNEPVGTSVAAVERSTSKSAVSRVFIERTRVALGQLMSRRLDDVRLAAMMLDGIDLKERTHVVALGITTEGVKIPLGLWEGSTENATVARALLTDLVERGLDPEQGILFVLDGAKALRKAIRQVFGEHAVVQRCVRHKERNVLGHLADRDRPRPRPAPALSVGPGRPGPSPRTAPGPRPRTRPDPPRCCRVTQGGPGGDDHHPAPQGHRDTETHALQHEPDRVDDRDRPQDPTQRQALAIRGHGPQVDRRRDAPSPTAIPEGRRLQATRRARHQNRTRRHDGRSGSSTARGGNGRSRQNQCFAGTWTSRRNSQTAAARPPDGTNANRMGGSSTSQATAPTESGRGDGGDARSRRSAGTPCGGGPTPPTGVSEGGSAASTSPGSAKPARWSGPCQS